jgi:hypothetical protein
MKHIADRPYGARAIQIEVAAIKKKGFSECSKKKLKKQMQNKNCLN